MTGKPEDDKSAPTTFTAAVAEAGRKAGEVVAPVMAPVAAASVNLTVNFPTPPARASHNPAKRVSKPSAARSSNTTIIHNHFEGDIGVVAQPQGKNSGVIVVGGDVPALGQGSYDPDSSNVVHGRDSRHLDTSDAQGSARLDGSDGFRFPQGDLRNPINIIGILPGEISEPYRSVDETNGSNLIVRAVTVGNDRVLFSQVLNQDGTSAGKTFVHYQTRNDEKGDWKNKMYVNTSVPQFNAVVAGYGSDFLLKEHKIFADGLGADNWGRPWVGIDYVNDNKVATTDAWQNVSNQAIDHVVRDAVGDFFLTRGRLNELVRATGYAVANIGGVATNLDELRSVPARMEFKDNITEPTGISPFPVMNASPDIVRGK